MATTRKSYSYHVQLALLTTALEALKKADAALDEAFNNEVVQLGVEDASDGEYHVLTVACDDLRACLEDHVDAVKALAAMMPPDMVTSSPAADEKKAALIDALYSGAQALDNIRTTSDSYEKQALIIRAHADELSDQR